MEERKWRATVSGSFRQSMTAVQDAVYALTDLGVDVLSPADPRVVDHFGDFLFVASDRLRTIRLVQQRHLAAIAESDFVWLVAEDGYVGTSASMEIGFAVAVGTPVYASGPPMDLTLRQFVHIVRDMNAILRVATQRRAASPIQDVLLDPAEVIDAAHRRLEVVRGALLRPTKLADGVAASAAEDVRRALQRL